MDDKKRVILITGDSSKLYEQVIFIMRPNISSNNIPIDFVQEAERIINNYIKKNYNAKNTIQNYGQVKNNTSLKTNSKIEQKNNKNLHNILNIGIVFCCILLGVILYTFTH